jgi:hypothetical protein
MISEDEALKIKARHERELMTIEGVEGVGLGDTGDECVIKVYVTRDTPEMRARLPERLEDCRIVVEASGEFRADS